jgi:hypothetical protein
MDLRRDIEVTVVFRAGGDRDPDALKVAVECFIEEEMDMDMLLFEYEEV